VQIVSTKFDERGNAGDPREQSWST